MIRAAGKLAAVLLMSLLPVGVLAGRPNVILIMTDDQGYGDLACHGNPVIKTPQLDRLHSESVRLTDFHVSPFCTPTRAALMTGRYPARTGAYRTSSGRSMLHTDEVTLADIFADAGYRTGMIAKWHLGDNAPHRPQDRGFQDVVWHRGGGIGQAMDYWGNDYFDDTYERNGIWETFTGYCTDVWFNEAMRFVDENRDKPFFLYLAPNAPHSPYIVDKQWSDPYRDKVKWKHGPEFYGMIENIDWNVGRLRDRLDQLGLAENTIFIFLTDNGTAKGLSGHDILEAGDYRGFNAGMAGVKSTVLEGGHRVPFFIHWPAGGVSGGRDAVNLSAHMDVLPTLAELCGISLPASLELDGRSFAEQLTNPEALPHRDHVIVQLHGSSNFKHQPQPWETSCVINDRWRLMDGERLANLDDDPMQRGDVSAGHPEVVAELRALYETFWASVSPRMTPVSIDLGNPAENPTFLCSHDWYMETGNPPWHAGMIRQRIKMTGPWNVDVKQAGRYHITLRQLPPEASGTVAAVRAKLTIAGQEMKKDVEPGSEGVVFEMDLPVGKTELQTWLYDPDDTVRGAYYAEVEWLGPAPDSASRPPNIIFLFADDWGWGDLSRHGHEHFKTPYLDKLAAQGTSFHQFTVASGVCSPSRTAVMTGHYPARYSIHQHLADPQHNKKCGMPDWLDPRVVQLPRLLKEAGYKTAHYGKWHLTNTGCDDAPVPAEYGYDDSGVFNGNGPQIPADDATTYDKTIEFITKHKDEAFFINVWMHEPHTPHFPKKVFLEPFDHLDEQHRVYAAILAEADHGVGRIMKTLDDLGLAENTLLIFSSDNGPEETGGINQKQHGSAALGTYYSVGSTAGLKGRKRSLYEGGVRVPFLVRWPGRVPAGATNDATVITAVDLLPTFCAAAGIELPDGYRPDGENMLEAFLGQNIQRSEPIFWEWRGPPGGDNWPRLAIRDGDWKLLVSKDGRRRELYDIPRDRAERNNLAEQHPEMVESLSRKLQAWRNTLPETPAPHWISRLRK